VNTFTIDGTEFGVNPATSLLSLARDDSGEVILMFELEGDQAQYDALTEPEDGEWSWTLYPPHLYIRGLRVPQAASSIPSVINLPRPGEIEAALYLMAHNEISNLSLFVSSARIEVTGEVDLFGEVKQFQAKFEQPVA